MKKYNSITVKELLDLEDGYYNLMSPIPYVIGDGGGKELDSVECKLEYGDETHVFNIIDFHPIKTLAQLTNGDKYHVKLLFSSGFIAEKTLECIDGDGFPTILFDADMFDNLYTGESPSGIFVADEMLGGRLSLTTPQDENKAKYGGSVVITITEATEINGIIRIITDVAPSGVTKIITTMNDNLSCFVENVLQDGDVLSVIATDKDAGEGGGGGDDGWMRVYGGTIVTQYSSSMGFPWLSDTSLPPLTASTTIRVTFDEKQYECTQFVWRNHKACYGAMPPTEEMPFCVCSMPDYRHAPGFATYTEGSHKIKIEVEKPFKVYITTDGSVDTTKTGMSGVDVYKELLKHRKPVQDQSDMTLNCVVIMSDGTELNNGHVEAHISGGESVVFPIDDERYWQIGEKGYGSIEYRSV